MPNRGVSLAEDAVDARDDSARQPESRNQRGHRRVESTVMVDDMGEFMRQRFELGGEQRQ